MKHISEKVSHNLDKKCLYCKSLIEQDATMCHYCGKYQKKWKNFLPNIPILISIALLIISFLQYQTSRLEKYESSLALDRASKLEVEIKEVGLNFSNSIRTSSKLLQEVHKSTHIWNDEENINISNSIDSLIGEMDKYADYFARFK